ncbi:MAG: 3-deoxy-D-manno-octulosonic acid kinase [Gammaproteobacteria bacterium]|nr:3-deoxy-D-manno-octulosonic acid kinase [Gammaproteobacteria bacterium]
MAVGPEIRIQEFAGGAMLYDSSRAGNAAPGWLDASWWAARGAVHAAGEGRGAAVMIEADGRSLVLRHYRRGGLMARLVADRYWWRAAERTRSFREWHLLYHMHRAGLPVPMPIAAGYRRRGGTYTADLLVKRIPGARSLAAAIRVASVPLGTWMAIGRCLRHFHARGICHADLNAHNILLGEAEDDIWVIDFDRGSLRSPGWWSDANLVRLQRSLLKVTAAVGAERFSAADWQMLLDSYLATAIELRQIPALQNG